MTCRVAPGAEPGGGHHRQDITQDTSPGCFFGGLSTPFRDEPQHPRGDTGPLPHSAEPAELGWKLY